MNGIKDRHYVVHCPLENCHWTSEPLGSMEATLEARRTHLMGHAHSDLVDHIASSDLFVDEYHRKEDEYHRKEKDNETQDQ